MLLLYSVEYSIMDIFPFYSHQNVICNKNTRIRSNIIYHYLVFIRLAMLVVWL